MWLFLDDKRKDPTIVHNNYRGLGNGVGKANNWVIARDYHQFIDILKNNFDYINFISFDHDISSYDINEKELTGKDAAEFLINYCMDHGLFILIILVVIKIFVSYYLTICTVSKVV